MEPSQDLTGTVIKGTYQIDAFLGEGGPSVVYKGTDLLLDVPVAIKRLKHLASMGDGSSMAERFLREGRTQARLVHQNIIGIRAVLEENDEYYIVMEYVAGCDLSRLLAELPTQRLSFDGVASIFLQVLHGLGYAHEHQVIHRDIKPSNIMVTPESRVKIADFGIARAVTDSRITQTGYLVGTVAYMCPEQLKGLKVDHRADIYSLGISLFEALTGQHPFRIHEADVSNFEVMSRHIYEEAPPVSTMRPDASPLLSQVVARALAKEPDDRFPTCEAFARALEEALDSCGVDARSPATEVLQQEFAQAFANTLRPRAAAPITDGPSIGGPSADGPTPDAPAAEAAGTGAFDRDAQASTPPLEDISEERPSGVLLSVTPPQPSPPMDRGTAAAPLTPAERLRKQQATAHDLDPSQLGLEAIVAGQQTQPDTGSFFRDQLEEAAQAVAAGEGAVGEGAGTGAFDREALSQKIQQQKAAPAAAAEAALAGETVPDIAEVLDTRALDAAVANAAAPAKPAPAAPEARRGGSTFFVLLLCAGLLFGGVAVGYFRGALFPSQVTPPQARQGVKPSAAPAQAAPDAGGSSPLVAPRAPLVAPRAPADQPPGTSPQVTPRQPQVTPPQAAATCPSAMIYIAGGAFWQGEARAKKRNDRPRRQVQLSPFCIDRHEVTVQQYLRCVAARRCAPLRRKQKPGLPVRWVTWGQAFTYCRWAGYKRLPTEAEWERAARGQTQTLYPWGDKRSAPTCEQAISRGCRGPKPPASGQRSNTAGVHDMLGNVWEWVHDCYNPKAYQTLPQQDPKQEPTARSLRCRRRVIRGGSYRSGRRSQELMPFFRGRLNTTRSKPDVGFRCAASPQAQRKPRREL